MILDPLQAVMTLIHLIYQMMGYIQQVLLLLRLPQLMIQLNILE